MDIDNHVLQLIVFIFRSRVPYHFKLDKDSLVKYYINICQLSCSKSNKKLYIWIFFVQYIKENQISFLYLFLSPYFPSFSLSIKSFLLKKWPIGNVWFCNKFWQKHDLLPTKSKFCKEKELRKSAHTGFLPRISTHKQSPQWPPWKILRWRLPIVDYSGPYHPQ